MRVIFPRGSIVHHRSNSMDEYLQKMESHGPGHIPVIVERENNISTHTITTGKQSRPHHLFNSQPVQVEWMDLVPEKNMAEDVREKLNTIPGMGSEIIEGVLIPHYTAESNGIEKSYRINIPNGLPDELLDKVLSEVPHNTELKSDTLHLVQIYGQSNRNHILLTPLGNVDQSSVLGLLMPNDPVPCAYRITDYGIESYAVDKWKQKGIGVEYIVGIGIMEYENKTRVLERTPMLDQEGYVFFNCDYKYMGKRIMVNHKDSLFYLDESGAWSAVPESHCVLDTEVLEEIDLYKNIIEYG